MLGSPATLNPPRQVIGIQPKPRQYYAQRHGRGPKAGPLALETVKRLLLNEIVALESDGFFQEAFGNVCIDDGYVAGTVGNDIDAFFLRAIMREGVWPVEAHIADYDADTLFDVLEVLHDVVSEPTEGHYHGYGDCGMHYSVFDRPAGQARYCELINEVLQLSDPGYELDDQGRVMELAPAEFRTLLQAPVPAGTEHDLITRRIDAAVTRFRTRGASPDDRRHAVRDLADVLEALRPDIKEHMLTADEKALFHVANGFAIRHNSRQQRGDYARLVWLRWAFYVYLATIHAVLRVRKTQSEAATAEQPGG